MPPTMRVFRVASALHPAIILAHAQDIDATIAACVLDGRQDKAFRHGQPGDRVNLEIDTLARYVARLAEMPG